MLLQILPLLFHLHPCVVAWATESKDSCLQHICECREDNILLLSKSFCVVFRSNQIYVTIQGNFTNAYTRIVVDSLFHGKSTVTFQQGQSVISLRSRRRHIRPDPVTHNREQLQKTEERRVRRSSIDQFVTFWNIFNCLELTLELTLMCGKFVSLLFDL
jgi:hypothetical protein